MWIVIVSIFALALIVIAIYWYVYYVNVKLDHDHSSNSSDSSSLVPLPYDGKEVYNLGSNIFTYVEAEAVCKAFDGELASHEQLVEAYNKGADWCNYGWSKEQHAFYPTQHATFDKLQKGSPSQQHMCGKPGINGGFFKEKDMRFGANCYGKRPDERDIDRQYLIFEKNLGNTSESELHPISVPEEEHVVSPFEKLVRKYRHEKDELVVLPFSSTQWKEIN
jgi:hypothetical protein